MITDHSSAGFEYLLLDRPLVRIHRPELMQLANVHPDYADLLASVADSTRTLEQTLAAVEKGLANPRARSATTTRGRRRPLLPAGHAPPRGPAATCTKPWPSKAPPPASPLRRPVPLVSVIMPAYNVEPYIGAAIESALEQTFDDYEILIVDDGSTDRTASIAAAYGARSERIRLITQANRGLSAARNAALRAARGAFLALLDGDDIWDPGFLEQQMAVFRAAAGSIHRDRQRICLGSWRDGQPAQPYPDVRPEPTLLTVLEDEQAIFVMSVFRRSVYEGIGGFDEALRTNEDYDYWIRAAAAGFVFARNDQPLGRYRRRNDSLSASDVRMVSGILKVFAKNRPLFGGRPAELAVIDRQVHRFEVALLGAQARAAIEQSDFETAATNLDALHARRPGALLAMARLMAHWSPVLLSRAYGFRRTRRALGAHLPS